MNDELKVETFESRTECIALCSVVMEMGREDLEALCIALLQARMVDGFDGRVFDADLVRVFHRRVDDLLPDTRVERGRQDAGGTDGTKLEASSTVEGEA